MKSNYMDTNSGKIQPNSLTKMEEIVFISFIQLYFQSKEFLKYA